MRLLIACSECSRQYDATGREPDSRFRCRCGAVVVIVEPKAHEADVVRCSSCGGLRESGAVNCEFCSADFTLHDRDLDTVCPTCFARVSSRAKFCHHCGIGVAPESMAGDKTELLCADCEDEPPLSTRPMGIERLTLTECGRCAGLWLGHRAFRELTQRASEEGALSGGALWKPLRPKVSLAVEESGEWKYRKCPECRELMQRRSYQGSGVILDTCREHGIWFDMEELPRILAWLREGHGTTGLLDKQNGNDTSLYPGTPSKSEVSIMASLRPGGAFEPEDSFEAAFDKIFESAVALPGRVFTRFKR